MCAFVNKCFVKYVTFSIVKVYISLLCVDQKIIIAAPETMLAIMNPHCMNISSKNPRQPPNSLSKECCMTQGLLRWKFLIHLNFYRLCFIWKLGIETPSISNIKITTTPPVIHVSVASSLWFNTLIDSSSAFGYPLSIQKNCSDTSCNCSTHIWC